MSEVKCPKCGSGNIFREEVDIGVGVLYGPIHCHACDYDESAEMYGLLDEQPSREPERL